MQLTGRPLVRMLAKKLWLKQQDEGKEAEESSTVKELEPQIPQLIS